MTIRTNLERFAEMVTGGTNPHAAAAKINGELDTPAVRRVMGVLADHGMPWDLARAKARNLVATLDVMEGEVDRVAELGSSLLRDDCVLASVVHEVARQILREWEAEQAEASHG